MSNDFGMAVGVKSSNKLSECILAFSSVWQKFRKLKWRLPIINPSSHIFFLAKGIFFEIL